MTSLPDYLPVCNLIRGADPQAASWLAAVQEGLRTAGIRSVVYSLQTDNAVTQIARLAATADLLFVEPPTPVATGSLRLGVAALPYPPSAAAGQHLFSCAAAEAVAPCVAALLDWLHGCAAAVPLWGCVLIGGRSSRMGRPKHLLVDSSGISWLEQITGRLGPFVERCVISGRGEVPVSCHHFERVTDLPGISGPLAGIGAVMRQYPWTSWVVLACDLPDVSAAAIDWLLKQRRPGVIAVIPHNPVSGKREPLFAWYDFRCRPLLDQLCGAGILKISALGGRPGICEPVIPDGFIAAWRNVNRPEDI